MGSGGMIVMDSTSSMVDVARFFMEFSMDESCGKCIPCRVGTVQMHGLLDKLTRREATAADLALLEELCDMVKETSLCGLGQAAPNPVLSTLRFFRDEYEAVLQPAGEPLAEPWASSHLTIDGQAIRPRRPDHPGGGREQRHRDPHPVPPGRPGRRRRLPACACSRSSGTSRLSVGLHHPSTEGMVVAPPAKG
jgi:hypothetical protein